MLHPELVEGKYAFYTRPMDGFIETGSGGGIGFGLCSDITHAVIDDEKIISRRVYHTITEAKNGAGAVPFKGKKCWIHIAHGVRNTAAGLRYVLYAFGTDLNDPSKVIASPSGVFLVPLGHERVGDVSNVVFTNGAIALDNGAVYIYYASSDTRMHVATTTIERLEDYLFNTRNPDVSVTQAAESAMREVVGSKSMDSVLFESKAEIAEDVRKLMQAMLDRYGTGIEVMSVAIQNAQPPEPVQAAFNDAVKAGQDRERSINLGEAYMNAVIPKAEGTASRLKEEAAAYKARVVETARGDADRFASVFEEYRKAPEVTRDRLYIDAMRDVYRNVTKVVVDAKGGNNLLYLPLDKIVSQTKSQAQTEAAGAVLEPAPAAAEPAPAASGTSSSDARPRDLIRNRGR